MINMIWPIPIYSEKIDYTFKEEDIPSEWTSNYSNKLSKNKYILDTHFSGLKEKFQDHVKLYVNEICPPMNENLEFPITQSWISLTEPDKHHKVHCHSNSYISGVFYLKTIENDCVIYLDPLSKIKNKINFPLKKDNIFSASVAQVGVKDNILLLFPSWLDHEVSPNMSQMDRYSLAFNVWIKGEIGEIDTLSKLIL